MPSPSKRRRTESGQIRLPCDAVNQKLSPVEMGCCRWRGGRVEVPPVVPE